MKNVLIVLGSVLVVVLTIPTAIKVVFSMFLYMIDNPWQVIQVTASIVCIWILIEQLRNSFKFMEHDSDSI